MKTATQALIVKYLKEDDLCIHELSNLLRMKPSSLRYSINKLIEKKLIKHVGWKKPKSSGLPLKIYSSLMYRKSAEKYVCLTASEKNKRYVKKFKALIALRRKKRQSAKKVDKNLALI